MLSVCTGQVTHALLTRPPLSPKRSLDLHVLGTPPAFILSQDQTLKIKFFEFYIANEFFANAQNSVAQNKISLLYPLRCYLKISGMVCMAFELFVRTKYICCSVFKVHLKLSFYFLFSCPLSRTSIIISAFTFCVNTFLKLFLKNFHKQLIYIFFSISFNSSISSSTNAFNTSFLSVLSSYFFIIFSLSSPSKSTYSAKDSS